MTDTEVIAVDRTLCRGYAVCVGIAGAVFDLDDDGLAFVREGLTSDSLNLARRAERRCPQKAITVNVPTSS